IELAVEEARALGHKSIGTEHLLLGMLAEGQGIAAGVLRSLGANLEVARMQVLRELSGAAPVIRDPDPPAPPRGRTRPLTGPARAQGLGQAEIVEQPNVGGAWVSIATRMAARYMGAEDGPKYLVPTLDRPRWLIRVRPERITTWAGGGWHRRYVET